MKTIFTVLLSISVIPLFSQVSDTIDYFGQTSPGNVITKFAPGIVSLPGRGEVTISFSPDGKELFLTVDQLGIFHSLYEDGEWQAIEEFQMPPSYPNTIDQFVFSPVNNVRYNWGFRNGSCTNIGISFKPDTAWTDPTEVDIAGGFLTATLDSTIFFTINKSHNNYIYHSKFNGTVHEDSIPLPYPVNYNPEFILNDPCVSPDGSYIVLVKNAGACYVCFKREENRWTYPKLLISHTGSSSQYISNPDNVQYFGLNPLITPDGKYLITHAYDQNGNTDLYWVSTDVIETARNSNFKPYIDARIRIPDFTDSIGNTFSCTIPDTLFNDDDGNETLTITATEYGMDNLPGWLDYDHGSRTISGELTETGIFHIEVMAVDTAGASISDIFKLTVIEPSSLSIHPITRLKIYPNPTNGILQIENIGSYNKINFEIYSLTGQLIQTDVLTGNSIDLTHYNKGVYLLRLNTEDQTYIERILVE